MKAVVAAFNQEKALVGAFSVIVQLHRLIVYTALTSTGTLLTTVHTNISTINILCMPTLHSHALDLQSIDAEKDQGVIVPTEINMLHCCTLPVSQKMQLS